MPQMSSLVWVILFVSMVFFFFFFFVFFFYFHLNFFFCFGGRSLENSLSIKFFW